MRVSFKSDENIRYFTLRPIYITFFFWVFPRRQIKFCRRFGTLCQVHLQRLDEKYSSYSVTSSLISPNITLNTQFSNTLSLRSTVNANNQVSHPY
jgi:hypothetical protein